ncbi:MAG: hypothetical protein ABIZ80_21930, partial [Bryobacteraceae bacterium]
ENEDLRVTVLVEGGHIAEFADKRSNTNPMWTPPWPSMEPSAYSPKTHPQYGAEPESKLLAGIMGHNLCLDVFGGPSPEEQAAGIGVHGESSVVAYEVSGGGMDLTARANLPLAQLRVERRLRLAPGARVLHITETVENLSATDRPVAWTQHVTLGPPYLEKGVTQFRMPGTRSKVIETDFGNGKGLMKIGAEFDWPNVPRSDRGSIDLSTYTSAPVSAAYTAHLMDPHREQAWFTAFTPSSKLAFGYAWKRSDFPWLGIWEENMAREHPPWHGKAVTRGMEFGASPMPESRKQMIERGSLFGVPGYRWLGAKTKTTVQYCAFLIPAAKVPESIAWDGRHGIRAE